MMSELDKGNIVCACGAVNSPNQNLRRVEKQVSFDSTQRVQNTTARTSATTSLHQ